MSMVENVYIIHKIGRQVNFKFGVMQMTWYILLYIIQQLRSFYYGIRVTEKVFFGSSDLLCIYFGASFLERMGTDYCGSPKPKFLSVADWSWRIDLITWIYVTLPHVLFLLSIFI